MDEYIDRKQPMSFLKKEAREVTCPVCGTKFETHHPRKRFCSQECCLKWNAKKRRENQQKWEPSEYEKMRAYEKKMKRLDISPPRKECFECPYSDCLYMNESDCPVLNRTRRNGINCMERKRT